jgi:hypothetical protein
MRPGVPGGWQRSREDVQPRVRSYEKVSMPSTWPSRAWHPVIRNTGALRMFKVGGRAGGGSGPPRPWSLVVSPGSVHG